MAMAEFSSVSVLIFLGLATLSTGERAFIQDKLPALRRLPSPLCHLRCAEDSNKAISEKECIRSCKGKLTLSLEQSKSHDSRNRMINPVINGHFIRRQRSVNNMNVLIKCQSTPKGFLQKAKNLLVNLTGEGWLHIKWEAIDSIKPDYNWTSYALIYHDDDSTDRPKCIAVPKNQTEYSLKKDGARKIPYSFHAAVVVNPYGHGEIELQRFTFRGTPKTFIIPTVPAKECQSTPKGFLQKAKNLLVNLTGEGWLHIKWEAIDSIKPDYNWTSYALIYHDDDSTDRPKCIAVPKNQTEYSLKKDGARKIPYSFHAAVVVNPYGHGEIELQRFTFRGTPKTFVIPTVPAKGTAKFIGPIVGGLIAGIVLLVILYAAMRWRKKPLCPDGGRMPPPLPHLKENSKDRYYSCYYPESEDFRKRVASIVNYFRENGYNVIMDQMVSEEITSQGPTRWGENQIRKAKKVLIFLSPGLVNLAMDSRDDSQCQDVNRVWIELEVLRDIYTKNRSAAQMVCIALPDVPVTSEVLPLWAKVSYKWPDDALEIWKRLNDRPMILPV